MADEGLIKTTTDRIRNSISIKIFVIGFLVLLLLIPVALVNNLIDEREGRRDEVVAEISDKWGAEQTLIGPVLTVPYKNFYKDEEGETREQILSAHFLPEVLNISGGVVPEIRYRGLYEAVLYVAELQVRGEFSYPDFSALNISGEDVLWPRAYVSLGVEDMKGIKEVKTAVFHGKNIEMNPGIESSDVLGSGISAKIDAPEDREKLPFEFTLALNGSQEISFAPVGKETHVVLSSSWPSPSFQGAFLPYERTVNDQGFEAKWKVLHLNRNYPQAWAGGKYIVGDSSFGAALLVAADVYQQSTRTAKYSILFILFTFAAFFFSEILNRNRIHPFQYLLIGLAIIIFYVLLISISEHLNFDVSYLLSSAAVIGLMSAYTKGILKSKRMALTVMGLLFLLYSYLYVVLQLENYALLMGSIGLFAMLSVAMYLTRNIDWYAVSFTKEEGEKGR